MKLPTFNFNDDKAGKPVGIQMHIGRQPIAAFGNSHGDLQMLEWARGGGGVRFALIVHHTDAEREWAYDRTSSIGRGFFAASIDHGQRGGGERTEPLTGTAGAGHDDASADARPRASGWRLREPATARTARRWRPAAGGLRGIRS